MFIWAHGSHQGVERTMASRSKVLLFQVGKGPTLWKKEAGKNGFLLMSNDNTTSDNTTSSH